MLCRLKHALRANNINLKYQPVYSTSSEKIVGFEALLRWRDPYFGLVSPDTLVNLAVQNGLMNTVSVYVIKKALSEMAQLIKAHKIFLSLNLSPLDLISTSFQNQLIMELERCQLSPASVMLEITEVPCNDLPALAKSVSFLASRGFRLAMDDFGKGCSDAHRLKKLSVSDVKIDRGLTHALFIDDSKGADVRSLCDSLSQMPYQLIFEGVESITQLVYLARRYPRSLVQGWYFSKAVSIENVRTLLSESAS